MNNHLLEADTLEVSLALARIPQIGSVTFKKIYGLFPDLREIFSLGERALAEKCPFLSRFAFQGILKGPDWEFVEAERERAHRAGVRILHLGGEDYPAGLLATNDPPPCLYVKGRLPIAQSLMAVVGTRYPTEYGMAVTKTLVAGLVKGDRGIVSGLALGIDGAAHRQCLESGGFTAAVLGSGVDVCYPKSHAGLWKDIAETGCLISEQPMGAQPEAKHFPRRNRIISGLSSGVLVTEAGFRSGALITLMYARLQKKPVYAVPGSIYNRLSLGPHLAIQKGAIPLWDARQILQNGEGSESRQCLQESLGVSSAPVSWNNPVNSSEAPSEVDFLLQKAPGSSDTSVLPATSPDASTIPAKTFVPSRQLTLEIPGEEKPPSLSPEAQKVWEQLQQSRTVEQLSLLCGSAPHRLLPILMALELAGWVKKEPGACYRRRYCNEKKKKTMAASLSPGLTGVGGL